MDLKSIINSDSSSNPAQTRQSSTTESTVWQEHTPYQQAHTHSHDDHPASYQAARSNSRPSQPSLSQSAGSGEVQSPSGSQAYRSTQSPYPSVPATNHEPSQYTFPQATGPTLTHPHHTGPFQTRDQMTTVIAASNHNYGQPSPSTLTPTSMTPGTVYPYSQFQRPHSSHSSVTPNSAQGHIQSFSRESPHPIHTQNNGPINGYAPQHYQSQPGTPLGPPPSIGRPSPVLHRDSSGPFPYETYRSHSGSSYSNPHVPVPSPTTERTPVLVSPASYTSLQPPSRSRSYMTDEERERSLSVSPKTRLPSQTRSEQMDVTPDADRRRNAEVTPSKRKLTDNHSDTSHLHDGSDQREFHRGLIDNVRPFTANAIHGQIGEQNKLNSTHSPKQAYQPVNTISPSVATLSMQSHSMKAAERPPLQEKTSSGSSTVTLSRQQPSTPQLLSNHQPRGLHTSPTPPSTGNTISPRPPHPSSKSVTPYAMESTVSPGSIVPSQRPIKKRQRISSPPIYAQSHRDIKKGNANPLLAKTKAFASKSTPPIKQEPNNFRNQGSSQRLGSMPRDDSNGHAAQGNEIAVPRTEPIFISESVLGPWEYNLRNLLLNEELTKTIADFLYTEVVSRTDVGVGAAGGSGSGAVLEVEAKLGQLIDRNTNDRLRLPVMTECVAQHKFLNVYLNDALKESLQPKEPSSQLANSLIKPRIPMTYVHTRERDAFYELSQSGELSLPPSIRAQVIPRHNKAKVRVTTDQKTGRELAKIVKVRVADLDVYNPRTAFDWRVSVNLEMRFDGDMRDLVEVMEGGKRAPERNKDRLSYRHLHYQIDLTQVSPAEATSNADKEHELEIELDTAELRKHGNFLQIGKPSGYQDLVQGFVDNVRLLARNFKA